MSIDIAKKQLMKLDKFIEGLQVELKTLAQYTDVGPSRALYSHFRALIKDLLDEQDPHEFSNKFQGINQAVAGILIVIVPSTAQAVNNNMQKAHGSGFDPSQLSDLVKEMNDNMPSGGMQTPSDPQDPSSPNLDEPEVKNDANELLNMLGLQDHVNPTARPGEEDAFGDVFKNY